MQRVLFGIGVVFIFLGAVSMALERVGLTPGRLPGDLRFGSDTHQVFIPITTCVLLSLMVSAIFWLMRGVHR